MASSGKGHTEGDSSTLAWNKSCVACSTGKRKCDGLRPCSRCLRKNGGATCTYLKRKVHKPHKSHKPRSGSSSRNGASDLEAVPDARREITAVATRNSGSHTGAVWPHWSQGVVPNKLKRCRLGASPATGLVGMQENNFLSTFFDCLGLKPLASESEIREAMVGIMSATKKPKQIASPWGSYEEDERNPWFSPDKAALQEMSLSDDDCSASAPSICMFWSGVAIGALLAGRPIESVESYVLLAEDARRRSKGSSTAKQIRTWMLSAEIKGFSDDSEGFQRDVHCAETLVHECRRRGRLQELPLWLIESVQKGKTVELLEEYNSAAAKSICRREIAAPPEISVISSNEDVYIFLVRIHKKLEQAMYGSCITGGTRDFPNGKVIDQVEIDHSAMEQLRDKLPMVEPLELVMQRTLAVAKATKKDDGSELEHLRAAVKVIDRYPGLFRFSLGTHNAHRVAAALAALTDPEARELYERVRAVYNRMRPPTSSPIPPFEEWQGVRLICNNPICWVMEALCRLPSRSPESIAAAGNTASGPTRGASSEHGIRVGDDDRGGEGNPVNSVSLSAWGDFQRRPINGTGDETQLLAQENDIIASFHPSTPAASGDEARAATVEALASDSESTGAVSNFGISGSSGDSNTSSDKCPSREENETANISPLPIFDGEIEDQAMMMMMTEFHQEGWADGSFIDASSSSVSSHIDISPEDWLHVAKDALPSFSS